MMQYIICTLRSTSTPNFEKQSVQPIITPPPTFSVAFNFIEDYFLFHVPQLSTLQCMCIILFRL
jgi:hypothetical protein